MSSPAGSSPLREIFVANVRAHLLYFRRSRLIIAFGLLLVVLVVLFSLPALYASSRVQGFSVLQEVFKTLNSFLIFFGAGLGLVIVSSHLRARNLKMVFTKPCRPAVWMGSALAAGVIVIAALDLLILAVALILSLAFKLPVEGGLVYISLDTLAASIGMTAYLMLLAMILHPVIAAAVAIIFGPWTFFGLESLMRAVMLAGHKSGFARALTAIFHAAYVALPMVHAFGGKTEAVYRTLRVDSGQWRYVPFSFGYAIALAALCYFLAIFFLQRKQLN